MNTLVDVKEIVDSNYTAVGNWLTQQARLKVKQPNELIVIAKSKFEEGLKQINNLSLSPTDRGNFKLIREAFELAVKACDKGSKGNYVKFTELMEESAMLAHRYSLIKFDGAVNKVATEHTS